ncbi:signal peptidase I [Streptomyces sp. NBC_01343]|uniref:signal peptidase I n=1 Tax=Streptomyces sp. NBC_01343 TaxID=2903832 RepID=UPI002E12F33B|nr:signal peptidase I [Streptomyces sp. NBC_01343]
MLVVFGVAMVFAALIAIGRFMAPGGYDGLRMGDESMAPSSPRGASVWYELCGADRVHRGDVVVVSAGQSAGAVGVGGRVLAVGGDRLSYQVGDRTLMLNGKPLAEPYLPPGSQPSIVAFDVQVPHGKIVALGDNRTVAYEHDFPNGQPGMFNTTDIRGRAVPKPNWLLVAAGTIALGTLLTLVGGIVSLSALITKRRTRPTPAEPAYITIELDRQSTDVS